MEGRGYAYLVTFTKATLCPGLEHDAGKVLAYALFGGAEKGGQVGPQGYVHQLDVYGVQSCGFYADADFSRGEGGFQGCGGQVQGAGIALMGEGPGFGLGWGHCG